MYRAGHGAATDLRIRIAGLLQKQKVSLHELQEVVGHLKFVCGVVAPGRAFLSRLCNAMKGLQCPLHRTRVTHSMKEELCMWSQFLAGCNGISFRRGEIGLKANFQVHLDAAG